MKQVLITDRKDSCDKMLGYTCHPGVRNTIGSMLFAIALCLTACGDDSSTSVNDDESSSSAKTVILSSSEGSSNSSSSAKSNGSSNGKSSSSSSTKKPSSSSKTVIQSSSSAKTTSSSVILSSSEGSSNSTPKSSSSVIPDSVPGSASSSSGKTPSSSSEYVPFDHSKTLAEDWRVGENRYKQFTDPRNGRSYYYITIYSEYKGYSVTVMAENLNIGEMVLGKNDQNDDTKIERYCYNNDTTKCDEFGGLYQWAEMMQLPSRCNTESCSELIQPNHQGICPDGWRLFTYDDFAVVMGYKDEFGYGIKGLRSAYGFGGNNYSGFSLTGAGLRTLEGGFDRLRETVFWAYPEEELYEGIVYVRSSYVSGLTDHAPGRGDIDKKTQGYSVRCVKVEQ